MLAERGVMLLEADRDVTLGLTDGAHLRLDGETLYDGAVVALDVHLLSPEQVLQQMEAARSGLVNQLDSFAHTTSAFLRQEQDLLLHGVGAPVLRADLTGRAVVVVGPAAGPDEIAPIRRFCREQKAVVIAVDGGAEAVVARRLRPDMVILSGAGTIQPKTLARCGEVLLTGPGEAVRRRAEKANVPVQEVASSMAPFDLGLLLAQRGGARVVVPVGYPSALEDFIDRSRTSQASNVLTRLRVGSLLVEAAAVPLLYTGRVRRWHVAALLILAVGVLAASVAMTPIGQGWWYDLRPHLPGSLGR
jgi:uncharacterized membrane-anchored protein